jgi:hypothetical protein
MKIISCHSLLFSSSPYLSIGINGILPALGIFGCYRLWIGIIELSPTWFYAQCMNQIKNYNNTEPTYRTSLVSSNTPDAPVVDLGQDTGWRNIFWAFFYLCFVLFTLARC